MAVYTKTNLAQFIYKIINEKYSDPEYFYQQLKANLNRKIKANSRTVLTEEELKTKCLGLAKQIISEFNIIKINALEHRISDEIINRAAAGIELPDFKDYFFNASKEIMTEFTNKRFKVYKARARK